MSIQNYEERIIEMAKYILDNNTTIRATAQAFSTPKSTVHHNLSHKLKFIDYPLYKSTKKHLEENFLIKHIHGGEATKLKYSKLKNAINRNDEIESTLLSIK